MKDILRLTLVPTVICLIAGALLAFVHRVTAEPIARAKQMAQVEAMKQVLPPFDNDPVNTTVTVVHAQQEWVFHIASRNGAYAGTAVQSRSTAGYGGNIDVMVGIDAEDTLRGIAILDHKETPGLGANIRGEWQQQFSGLPVSTRWLVKKDGGPIDEITAATISSRAVVEATGRAIEAYQAGQTIIQDSINRE